MDNNMLSMVYSQAISGYYEAPEIPTQILNSQEQDETRRNYEQAMKPWEEAKKYISNNYVNEELLQEGWQETWAEFKTILDEIEENLVIQGYEASSSGDFMIRINGHNYEFKDESLVTIGRIQYNNIEIRADGTSRLHAIIRIFGDKIVIMDVGSYYGIKCVERSGEGLPLLESKDGERRPLIFDKDETVKLELGPYTSLVLSPKECVVCLEESRSYLSNCGHFALCETCAEILIAREDPCPLCRRPLEGPYSRHGIHRVMTQ